MEKIKIDELILELTSAHRQISRLCFSNELKPVKISIAQNSRSRSKLTLGDFRGNSGYVDGDMQITIWTLCLNGDPFQLLETLMHEMVHQINHQNNIKDCENNQRHNKKFKEAALRAGLLVERDENPNRGFTNTKLSETLKALLREKLDLNWEVLKLKHYDALYYEPINYKRRRTYTCKGCGLVITNSRVLRLKCLDCDLELV
ncbi:hypothetical protein SCHIN_v1c06860 [Spiroplasma chinense]|uniref:SprT-like domain-containing protein n=1 Tax=Spiroplasma chinense TaxID=216932 RepID=A0A5B9Y521_9MOLU|nr:SprT-like domain-containing protein [Spiroplasma chinense]QEH61883.1 hypothetical protein SCHIN_v1c06860 [Spiroplasma chinense]